MTASNARLEDLDRNMAVSPILESDDICYYDVRKPPFSIYGLHDPTTEPAFKRMPDEIAAAVSEGVKALALHPAGGRVRFSTDSPFVAIKAVMPSVRTAGILSLPGMAGLDLYIDSPDGSESRFHRLFLPPQGMTDGYESKVPFYEKEQHPDMKMRFLTVHLPPYNPLTDLYIGIKKGSRIGTGAPYRSFAPVVYYGSSITQGACASRPGNAYPNMVSRAIGIDYRNFGFSGNAKGEEPMRKYLASLEMSAFVSDYDHNATTDVLRATHKRLYETIRASHPDIPYIMLSRPDPFRFTAAFGDSEQSNVRRHIILDTFHDAVANGDRNVIFVDGESLFRGPFEADCTVDGTHPNDIGFMYMADALISVFKRLLRNGTIKPKL
jgi:hypothetical protein